MFLYTENVEAEFFCTLYSFLYLGHSGDGVLFGDRCIRRPHGGKTVNSNFHCVLRQTARDSIFFLFQISPLISPTGGNKALKQVVSDLLDTLVWALLIDPMP